MLVLWGALSNVVPKLTSTNHTHAVFAQWTASKARDRGIIDREFVMDERF